MMHSLEEGCSFQKRSLQCHVVLLPDLESDDGRMGARAGMIYKFSFPSF